MAEFSVIADVSVKLQRLLREEVCPEPLASPESIRLCSPAEKDADFQLGIFLYDIREMGEYRTGAPVRRGESSRAYPPRPLVLSYLIFLNSRAQLAAGAEVEQRVLGRVIQALADHPEIEMGPASPEDLETATVTFQNTGFEERGKVWNALSMPVQVGVYITISPVMLSSRVSQSFTRVVETEIRTGQRRVER